MALIAVYGSLRQGGGAEQLLSQARLLGSQWLLGYQLWDLGDYPGALSGHGRVRVEIYRIEQAAMLGLDRYEAVPFEFVRRRCPTRYGEAWIYLLPRKPLGGRRVISGDWMSVLRKREP